MVEGAGRRGRVDEEEEVGGSEPEGRGVEGGRRRKMGMIVASTTMKAEGRWYLAVFASILVL